MLSDTLAREALKLLSQNIRLENGIKSKFRLL